LDLQRFGQEGFVVCFPLGRLLTERVELGFQMISLEFLQQSVQFHHSTAS